MKRVEFDEQKAKKKKKERGLELTPYFSYEIKAYHYLFIPILFLYFQFLTNNKFAFFLSN